MADFTDLPKYPGIAYAQSREGIWVACRGYEPRLIKWPDFRALIRSAREGNDVRTEIRELVGDAPRINVAVKRVLTAWMNGELTAPAQEEPQDPDEPILVGLIDTSCRYDGGDITSADGTA